MKRVLIYTQWFDPEPTPKGLAFARELVKQGFSVEVLTGVPNYPQGSIYSGYKNAFFQSELRDGILIKRVYLYPNHDQSAIKRVLNYVSFAISSLIYLLFFQKKIDVIYTYHPPLTTGVVASIIRFVRKIPIVYDIQDMWPDTLKATGMLNNEKILSFIGKIALIVYQQVDKIVVLSPGFKKILIDRGITENKISVIPNWCDEEALVLKEKSEIVLPGENKFKLLFAGNLGKVQNLDLILDCSAKLQSKIDFIFLGNGVEKKRLEERKRIEDLLNVFFLPAVSMDKVKHYIQLASALLVFLKKDPLFEITIPSKTQAYMYSGKPIVMGVVGDAADLVVASNGGILISQTDVDLIISKLSLLVSLNDTELLELGLNSKKYYEENLSLSMGCKKFADIFNEF